MYRKTYIEVNTENLKRNVSTLVRAYPSYQYYIGVVKGNAYGHGYASAKFLVDAGINYLAVSSLEEAIAVRSEGIATPILCLQPIHIADIPDAIKHDITITLSSYDYFKKLIAFPISRELKIHLKINSGFNRLGVSDKNEVQEIVSVLKAHAMMRLEGIYSHFATTGIRDKKWDDQLAAFRALTSLIELKTIPIVHLGRSLTLLNHDKIDICTGVRIGIAVYGYDQTPKRGRGFLAFLRELKKNYDAKRLAISATVTDVPFRLLPAFSLYSEIIEVHAVQKGQSVGYGGSFVAEEDCFVGCVPIGYADGFFRRNVAGFVAIRGKRYRLIGVDMGILTVLVDETVHPYDKVELIGETVSVREVAKRNATTVYEILCAFKESLPRIFLS